jgi:hypothetical protein
MASGTGLETRVRGAKRESFHRVRPAPPGGLAVAPRPGSGGQAVVGHQAPCARLGLCTSHRMCLCLSGNARYMSETAAHLSDHAMPPIRVRQWVLSVPKRLRWYLGREPKAVTSLVRILLRVIEVHLGEATPGASPQARLGAARFVCRFGAALGPTTFILTAVTSTVYSRAAKTVRSDPSP